ncbi:MAG: nitrous oxide-stimulated promoter family protein [Desulfobacterales bacterium]|nr:nitrous oxide-stimulated promoter family protein [Desulfobacterales bacterium]
MNDRKKMMKESKTVEVMIEIFCHGKHGNKKGLCPECRELLDYAVQRLEKCPFQENKRTCAKCPVHCYKPDMRKKIRAVMKYVGPRMLYRHPVLSGAHFLAEK